MTIKDKTKNEKYSRATHTHTHTHKTMLAIPPSSTTSHTKIPLSSSHTHPPSLSPPPPGNCLTASAYNLYKYSISLTHSFTHYPANFLPFFFPPSFSFLRGCQQHLRAVGGWMRD